MPPSFHRAATLALALLLFLPTAPPRLFSQTTAGKFEPVSFSRVTVADDFWKPKMKKIATATLAACIYQTEVKTPRIRNFEKIVRAKGEKHEGIYYDDSDVYKALEAMAYSIATGKDSALEATADRWIDVLAAAQRPDGYLFTYYQLGDITQRWTDIGKHEDYCAGHLIEAGIAYFNATGKRKLLDVATRFADHIDSTMRLANKRWFSGHQEIELALMKLYRLTGNDRYLKLAEWYLAGRGRGYYAYTAGSWLTPDYWQDMAAVKDQTEITGHAVRAMYLYSGAADVAAVTGDTGYLKAMETVWSDVVKRNMYVTGGIGAQGDNEGFGKDYELPNDMAYCETCASVGMVFWNARMNRLTGDARYVDVLERSLYNGALDGLSLSGDRFFYDNVLASDGKNERREWFGTACCPANVSRLVASIGDYVYGRSDAGIWVNLFIGSSTTVAAGGTDVAVTMKTKFPWEGRVTLTIDPAKEAKFALRLRVPSWATGAADPDAIYSFVSSPGSGGPGGAVSISVNGASVPLTAELGYAVVDRAWKKGDVVEYVLPMEVRKVAARPEVSADRDRVALQRGPLVYCVEGADNGGSAWNFLLPSHALMTTRPYNVAGEPVVAIETGVSAFGAAEEGTEITMAARKIVAIPYYAWANRGANQMQVWLPVKISDVKINR
jgi:DUF1680 family protein